VILDSSLLIAAERGKIPLPEFLDSFGDEQIGIAAITASELLHGGHRATDAGIRARRFAHVEAVLDAIPVLPFGLIEARRHAELWAELARHDTPAGAHDLQVGATALALGWRVATLNVAEFARMPGVEVVAGGVGSREQ
jgi:tRNA(fMet)-specific endonuclease VapC